MWIGENRDSLEAAGFTEDDMKWVKDMSKKKKIGRPSKMTESTIGKLEQAFSLGCTDREACVFADINPDTLYSYCEKNPWFTERKETLRKKVVLKARTVILDSLEEGDVRTAKWLLDKAAGKARQMVEIRDTHLSHEECLALLE